MMKNKYKILIVFIVLIGAAAAVFIYSRVPQDNTNNNAKVINPVMNDVEMRVVTTGIIEPQNRLEIKPSIGGRIEEILVKEGDEVTTGEILAWMSSTERAALIDAARAQGEEALKYWEEAYKKTPIISPIDGKVIVRSVEPGQTVTVSEAVLVLSDRLVVKAQFDETDIGRVKIGQKSVILLDAYPEVQLKGVVDHVAYESEIINNVTIYEVDILPEAIPEVMRSGMSVTAEVIEKTAINVTTIPSNTIHYDEEREYVLLKDNHGNTIERDVKVGLNNDEIAEVILGLGVKDNVVVQDDGYIHKRKKIGTNPFMPSRRR